MAEKKQKGMLEEEPQKSSAAQFLTYIASTGAGGEKYEIRYENENIWMSQKMLAAVATASRISGLRNSTDVDVSNNIGYINAQGRLFMSNYDRYLLALEEEVKKKEEK